MRSTQLVDYNRLEQVLRESIEEKRQAVVTHQCPDGWRMFKAAFRAGSRTSRTIAIDVQLPEGMSDAGVPRPGAQLGVTFRLGHKKYLFATSLNSIERYGDKAVVSLQWPETIQQLQRRVYERARPPRNAAIAVRLWRSDDAATSSSLESRTVRHGQLENLSAGGMQVRVADPTDFEPGRTFRCIFTPRRGKPSIIVDALVRHREAADRGRASIGFQFLGLEVTPEGHGILDRLARTVSEFQRSHSRGRRRGEEGDAPSGGDPPPG